MKHSFIILALFSLITLSCKKDRVCSCTVTTSGTTITHMQSAGFPPFVPAIDTTTYQPLYSVNTEKRTYNKVSKSAMRSNCYATSVESLNESSTSSTAGLYNITTSQTGTKTYNCEIE